MMRNLRERLGELKLHKRPSSAAGGLGTGDARGCVFISVYREAETLWLVRVFPGGQFDEHEVFASSPTSAESWAREAAQIWPDLMSEGAEVFRN